MWGKSNVVVDKAGEETAYPIYEAGNLAARIAGRKGHFDQISSALRAGYRPVEQYTVTSLQQTAVTQPVDPKVDPSLQGAQGGIGVYLRPQG